MIRSLKPPLRDLSVWRSRYSLWMFGQEEYIGQYHILEIKLLSVQPSVDDSVEIIEDPNIYTLNDIRKKIRALNMEECVANVCCIYGFIKLLESSYLIVISKSTAVGEIHGNIIYTIDETVTIPIHTKIRNSTEEVRYRSILQKIDFSSGFYYSLTYDLTCSFQQNCLHSISTSQLETPCHDMYAWNYYCIQPFLDLIDKSKLNGNKYNHWVIPIIYGFFHQFCVRLHDSQTRVKYTLISRRSRHFAGTRNLRRGVNYEGYVANEIETEQIVTVLGSILYPTRSSSLIQHRGSIPIFWSHVNLFTPSPDIQLEPMDYNLSPTNKHFLRLFRSYGNRVIVLNLVKQSDAQREILLGTGYREACSFMNKLYENHDMLTISSLHERIDSNSIDENIVPHIIYLEYDMLRDNHESENDIGKSSMITRLHQISESYCSLTGFFTQAPFHKTTKSKDVPIYEIFPSSEFCKTMYIRAIESDDQSTVDINDSRTQSNDDNFDVKSMLSDIDDMNVDNLGLSGPISQTHDEYKQEKEEIQTSSDAYASSFSSASNLVSDWYNNFNISSVSRSVSQSSSSQSDSILQNSNMISNTVQKSHSIHNQYESFHETISSQRNQKNNLSSMNNSPVSQIFKQQKSINNNSSSGLESTSRMNDIQSTIIKEPCAVFNEHSDIGKGIGYSKGLLQYGVMRSNCVDCLDRTNIGQFCYAKTILPQQLLSLGIDLSSHGLSQFSSKMLSVWVEHGDKMAQQYGGSVAMHKLDEKDGNSLSGKKEIVVNSGALNAVTAMQRYYSNISTDFERQQAIDLLLGVFIPKNNNIHVWEVDQRPQQMRQPSDIESCLRSVFLPFLPIDSLSKKDSSMISEITSFQKLNQDAYAFGVLTLDNLPYRPYPHELVSSHLKATLDNNFTLISERSVSIKNTESKIETEYDILLKDMEVAYQTKMLEENILVNNDISFDCFGTDDIYEIIRKQYEKYLQDCIMNQNIDIQVKRENWNDSSNNSHSNDISLKHKARESEKYLFPIHPSVENLDIP